MMFYDGFWWMWIIMVIFWIIVIGLIVWGITAFARRPHEMWGQPRSNAMDIARERYAKGEITKEQYEQIKKDLMG